MRVGTKGAADPGLRRRRSAAGVARLIVTVAVLVAIASGYHSAMARHRPPSGAGTRLRTLTAPPPAAAATDPAVARAAIAAAGLQRRYAGAYTQTHLWQAANALMATMAYMRATGSRGYLPDLSATYQAHHTTDHFLGRYYDDEGWWVLTWVRAYQLTGDPAYLRQARSIFRAMTRGWTGTCGGGVLWRKHRTYKDAITNELFLQDAVLLHELTPGDTRYARWAVREWHWFSASGMLTGSHLVVDGLAGCQPDLASPVWTYNQGMLIGALVSLAAMTGHASPLTTAGQVAGAVIGSPALSPGGILREPCRPRSCGRDEPLFKGIFVASLKLLYDRVGGAPYQSYLRRNAAAMWAADRRGSAFGVRWAGPFRAPGMAAQASALDLLTTQIPASGR